MGTKKSGKRVSKKEEPENDKTKQYKIKKKKGKHPKLKKFIKIALIIFVILAIIGVGVIAGAFMGFFGDDFTIESSDLELQKLTSVVKDKDGNVIANLSGEENRKVISRQDMPDYLPKAFVSIEDERFYTHHGVDLKRTASATVSYIIHLGKGTSSGGGSTITQQLVKNITDNGKDSSGLDGMIRKVREMSKAMQVEKMLSKDQILELYLNTIFMGDQAYGVEVASQYYFSKSAKDLNLAECAFLAGINNSPNLYRPFETKEEKVEKAKEKIRKRTLTVLGKMKELGAITNEEEYNTAVDEVNNGLHFVKGNITDNSNYSYHTAAAINQVKQQLMDEKGWSKELAEFNIYNNGYTIYTTQDTAIQARMEEEYVKTKYVKKGNKKKEDGTLLNEHTQSAMVIIDHKTGQVVGTVGGLGTESNAMGINRAIQTKRQTGSAMKPISVIAPGLEKGVITAGTVYDDCPSDFGKGYDWPKNYYKGYKGLSTIRDVIEISQNVIPVKIITEIGTDNAYKFVESMGVTLDAKDSTPSLALGGLTVGATPLEMAAAYATIANGGEYITPVFFTKVEDKNGKTVIEAKQEKTRVMSEQNAYIEQNILTQPVKGSAGTARACAISGMDVAAKTGTTNDDYDRWLCGFTPYYTAATWYGYDYNEKVVYNDGNPALRIWDAIIADIHKDLTKAKFEEPSGIVRATICKDTGLLAAEGCSRTYTEVFVKGTVPTEKCNGQTTVKICKETGKLANEYCTDTEDRTYTIKPPKEQNPKGWKSNHGDKFSEPPTETCTVHKKTEEKPPVNNNTNNTVDTNTAGGNTATNNTAGGNVVDPEPPDENTNTNNTAGGNTVTPPVNNTVT